MFWRCLQDLNNWYHLGKTMNCSETKKINIGMQIYETAAKVNGIMEHAIVWSRLDFECKTKKILF